MQTIKYSSRLNIKVVISLILLFVTTTCFSGSVQGKLEGFGPYGNYALARIAVTLSSDKMGRTAPSFTDSQGMYYLKNIPVGEYVLEIWPHEKDPITFPVVVESDAGVTQIPTKTVK